MSEVKRFIETGMILAKLKTEVDNFVLKYDDLKKELESERALRKDAETKLHELQDLFETTKIPNEDTLIEIMEYKKEGKILKTGSSFFGRYLSLYKGHPLEKIWDQAIKESRKRREGK